MVRTGFDDRPTREDNSVSVSNVLTRRTFTCQAKPTVAYGTQLLPAGHLANMGAFKGGGTRDPRTWPPNKQWRRQDFVTGGK